jgi:hypothetical protein
VKKQGIAVLAATMALAMALAPSVQAKVTHKRTIPVTGYQFDVDWANNDLYTGDAATMRRYDLSTGAPETSWSAPSGAIINDVAATTGGVYAAAAGTRALYAFDSDGTPMLQTDANTQNRIGDTRGLVVAKTGAYLVGGGPLLRISVNPFGYPQLAGYWGLNSSANTGWETCSPSPTPPPYCYGGYYGTGAEAGQLSDPRDLDVRENVENTGNFALYVLERRPLPGNGLYDYRVSVFSDEGVPTSFAPQGFLFGGSTVSNAGPGANQLNDPYGIAVDAKRGRIYIADQGNNRVAVYTFGGTFLEAFGWGVDTGANKLQECSFLSRCQAGLTTGALYNPLRVQVDPSNGDLFVSAIGGISEFSFPDGPVRAPKEVDLEAKPKAVKKNDFTILTASLLPCNGTQGEPVVFEKKDGKDWTQVGGKKSADRNCRAKLGTKIKQKTTFRAKSPQTQLYKASVSDPVTVKVK